MITYPTDKLQKVLLGGGCEQNGTPTPDNPIDIVCNNGALKVRNKSGIPLSYQELSYLESSGEEYIQLDDKLSTATDDIEIEVQLLDTTVATNFFGARNSTPIRVYTLATYGSENNRWRFGWKNETIVTGTSTDTNKHTLRIDHTVQTLSLDGTVIYTYIGTDDNIITPSNALLFGLRGMAGSTNYYLSPVRIFSFKKWTSGTLVQHLIPCRRRSDNELGMYDLVTDTFFTNAGTGTFTAGSIVDAKIYADGTQEQVTDNLGNTANAEMLLSVGDYKDTQSVLDGKVTRNIGIKVLDGTEDWAYTNSSFRLEISDYLIGSSIMATIISHYKLPEIGTASIANGEARFGKLSNTRIDSSNNILAIHDDNYTDLNSYKSWLADQYNAGTPVIIVYPLKTPTTKQVTPQPLAGNSVTQTAGSIDNLPIESSTIAELKKRYIGDEEVQRVYIGDNLVWEK